MSPAPSGGAGAARPGPNMRRYGPAVGEPPPWADPRRWGSLIGIAGGLVFIGSYSPTLGSAVTVVASVVGVTLAITALFWHYVHPVALGTLAPPRPVALVVYGVCVVAELALIAIGSRLLSSAGHGEVRPALIAAVVGLHFVPFAWAFGERMFFWLGGALTVLGGIGLVAGLGGVRRAAEIVAVVAGLTMLAIIAAYARGAFRRPSAVRLKP